MTTTSSFMSTAPALGPCAVDSVPLGVLPIVSSMQCVECRRASARSLDQGEQRLPFFDDVGGQLHTLAAADGFGCMDRPGRYEKDVTRLERDRRLTLDLVLQR